MDQLILPSPTRKTRSSHRPDQRFQPNGQYHWLVRLVRRSALVSCELRYRHRHVRRYDLGSLWVQDHALEIEQAVGATGGFAGCERGNGG